MIVLRSGLIHRETANSGMGRTETPSGDRSGHPAAPDRIAGSLRATQSLDSLASRTNALQQTHTRLDTFPLTLTPSINVWNRTVFTRRPAWWLLHQVRSPALLQLPSVQITDWARFSNSVQLEGELGGGLHYVPPSFICHSPRQHVGQLTCTFMASFPYVASYS